MVLIVLLLFNSHFCSYPCNTKNYLTNEEFCYAFRLTVLYKNQDDVPPLFIGLNDNYWKKGYCNIFFDMINILKQSSGTNDYSKNFTIFKALINNADINHHIPDSYDFYNSTMRKGYDTLFEYATLEGCNDAVMEIINSPDAKKYLTTQEINNSLSYASNRKNTALTQFLTTFFAPYLDEIQQNRKNNLDLSLNNTQSIAENQPLLEKPNTIYPDYNVYQKFIACIKAGILRAQQSSLQIGTFLVIIGCLAYITIHLKHHKAAFLNLF